MYVKPVRAIRAACSESPSNSCVMHRSTLRAVTPFSFCTSKITSDLFIPQQLKLACFQGFTRFPSLTAFVSADAKMPGGDTPVQKQMYGPFLLSFSTPDDPYPADFGVWYNSLPRNPWLLFAATPVYRREVNPDACAYPSEDCGGRLPEAPRAGPGNTPARLPADVSFPQTGRPRDPTQAPEQNLLPNQRGRARGGEHRRGSVPAARLRFLLSLLPRPGALPHAGRDSSGHVA